MISTGWVNEAITNAILDFSNSSRFYNQNKIFSVRAHDTLHRMALVNTNENLDSWVKGEIQEGILSVSIIPRPKENKLLLTAETIVGSKGKLPSRFIEINEKLFFWWDDDFPLSQAALDVYSKYDLLQDDEGGIIQLPDFIIDDSQKAVDYYFCKNNLLKYKKVTTKIAMGYYDIPKLECHNM